MSDVPAGSSVMSSLIRPRTTGEILDDAGRLYLADAPLLLAVSGLFQVPAAIVILLLLTQPKPESMLAQLLLPALLAVCVPLTGLGSAACQEVFRQRAEHNPVALGGCLAFALGHGPAHAAVRALVLTLVLPALFCLVMPGLAVWVALTTVHPILAAGADSWWSALAEASKQSQRNLVRAAAVTLARVPLLLLVLVNLHTFQIMIIGILDSLAGFDLAMVGSVLSWRNPLYDIVLVLVAWLLLAPFAEACNYLLYVDARARYEGLDLWYRVRRHFRPASGILPGSSQGGVVVALLTLSMALPASPARGADPRLEALGRARTELGRITKEVKAAEPYPGGQRWLPRLQALAHDLEREVSSRREGFPWFSQALTRFARADQKTGLSILVEIDQRLALLEEAYDSADDSSERKGRTRDEIKALVPRGLTFDEPRQKDKVKRPDDDLEPVQRDDDLELRGYRRGEGGLVAPRTTGFGAFGWLVSAGVLLAAVVLAFVLGRLESKKRAPAAKKPQAAGLSLETLLAQTDQPVGETLWRQADQLARAGNFPEALRSLYLAVLALLHRADLIRYAQTRTNREYLDQLRPHDAIYPPFEYLTSQFEVNWYGEKACQPDDFAQCRQQAEQVRAGMAR